MSQHSGSPRKKPNKHQHQHTPHRSAAKIKAPADQVWWNNPWLLLGLVLLATAVAFYPSLGNDFITSWDDGVYVTENASIRHLTTENIRIFFSKSINGTYVPLPLLSFAIEYQLFGLEPNGYHIFSLLLHLVCTALVFRILLLLELPVPFAALGTLFFGIHPMRVETVAWVTERKDLLFSLFYLSAIIVYIRYIRTQKHKSLLYGFTLLFFVLSLFSKIQAVALPLSFLLIDYYLERPLRWKLIWEKLPFFALSLAFGLFGIFFLEKTGSFEVNEAYTLVQRFFFGLYSLSVYLFKFFAPVSLSAYYPYPTDPGKSLPVLYYLNPLLLLGIAALVFVSVRKTRAIAFGMLFFLVNVMFLLQILGAGQAYQADRFTYIPYIGLFFIAGWGLKQLAEKNPSAQLVALTLAGAFVVFFTTQTYSRCKAWKDSLTLWTDVIEKYPGRIPVAYANRATAYRQLQQPQLALQDYNVAIQLDSSEGTSRMNRGNIFFDMNQDDLALRDYYAALSLNLKKNQEQSQINRLYCNLGSIYGRRGVFDSGLHYLNLSVAADSAFGDAWLNRGLTHAVMNNWELAIADYQKYIYFDPGRASVYSDIGVCYQNLQRYEESIGWFNKAISLEPGNGTFILNRSYSYFGLKQVDKARLDAEKANSLGTGVPPSYIQQIKPE